MKEFIIRESPDRIIPKNGLNILTFSDSNNIRSVGMVYEDIKLNSNVYIGIDLFTKDIICDNLEVKTEFKDILEKTKNVINLVLKNKAYDITHFNIYTLLSKLNRVPVSSNDTIRDKYMTINCVRDRIYVVESNGVNVYYFTFWKLLCEIRQYKKYVDYLIRELNVDNIKDVLYFQSSEMRNGDWKEYDEFFGIDKKPDEDLDNTASKLADFKNRLHMIKTQLPKAYKDQIDKI